MKPNEQIERIRLYERYYDELSDALRELQAASAKLDSLKEIKAELEKYYGGELWKKDFADDEKGLLPKGLKRGVLSEDGLYNLFEELRPFEMLTEGSEEAE